MGCAVLMFTTLVMGWYIGTWMAEADWPCRHAHRDGSSDAGTMGS